MHVYVDIFRINVDNRLSRGILARYNEKSCFTINISSWNCLTVKLHNSIPSTIMLVFPQSVN